MRTSKIIMLLALVSMFLACNKEEGVIAHQIPDEFFGTWVHSWPELPPGSTSPIYFIYKFEKTTKDAGLFEWHWEIYLDSMTNSPSYSLIRPVVMGTTVVAAGKGNLYFDGDKVTYEINTWGSQQETSGGAFLDHIKWYTPEDSEFELFCDGVFDGKIEYTFDGNAMLIKTEDCLGGGEYLTYVKQAS